MFLLIFLLLCTNVWATQVTMPNGDVVDQEGNVSYLITPGSSTLAKMQQQAQAEAQSQQAQQAQAQLTALRKQALNTVADAQIATNPTAQAAIATLKQQGAQ